MSAEARSLLTPRERALAELIAERAAERAVEILCESGGGEGRLVDAATVAAELGLTRATVYQHAERLGGRRIGDGPRARWRFDLDAARASGGRCGSDRSQALATASEASAGGESEAAPRAAAGRRARRLPNGLPPAGSVLAVRPSTAGRASR
jgi:DNA-binding CsgD family transcriptional regulator